MTRFDPIKYLPKITLLVLVNANVATAQQFLDGNNQSNVVVDYSVIESLSPSSNIQLKHSRKPSKGDGPNNLYTGPKLNLPRASRGQPSSQLDVIVLKPPKSIKKSPSPNHAKKSSEEARKTINTAPPTTVYKTVKIRPPPPPRLLTPSKTVNALPTPKFSELLRRPGTPPPSITALEQSVTLPPTSWINGRPKNVLPTKLKSSGPPGLSKTGGTSTPQISQLTEAESITRIQFSAGSFELNSNASEALKNLSKTLKKNTASRLQLHAYAGARGGSPIKAKRLALSRALAARTYLIDNGVGITRIAVKAFGDQAVYGPTDRIDIILTMR